MTTALLSPESVEDARRRATALLEGLDHVVLGQAELTRFVLVACLARGHVLLEGLPGLGKTELVKALAGLLGIDFRRLQFTPDLLPGDVTGGHILEEADGGARRLVFHPGPVFTHVLLADEINRASPKTQSALLEAMQERRVTVLGETRALPEPFYVLATQNPIELEGTYPLPEAQLDRFLFKLDVAGVDRPTMERIITERRGGSPPAIEPVLDAEELGRLFAAVDQVFLPKAVASYIARLVDASHPERDGAPELVRRYVRHGGSPRAAISIAESARANALLAGKPNVGFDDVRAVAPPAVAHRLVLDYRARLDGVSGRDVVANLLEEVGELAEGLPAELARARGARGIGVRRLATRLALACLALAPVAGAQEEVWLEDAQVRAVVEAPWPQEVARGFMPIVASLENLAGAPRVVELAARLEGWRSEHRIQRLVQVGPGERVRCELFVPAFDAFSWYGGYLVDVAVGGESSSVRPTMAIHTASGGPGGRIRRTSAGLAPHPVLVVTAEWPTAIVLDAWTQRLGTEAAPGVWDVALAVSGPRRLPRRVESYTSLDAVLVHTGGDVDVASLEPAVAAAKLGGVLALMGPDADGFARRIPGVAEWMQERFFAAEVWPRVYFFGHGLLMIGEDEDFLGPTDAKMVKWTFDAGASYVPQDGVVQAFLKSLPIPGLKDLPYRFFILLLILFAFLIGPINFVLVKRTGRPAWLLLSIPGLALFASLGILAYGIFYQGIDLRLASRSVTVLDQRVHRADTVAVRSFFAGIAPTDGLRPELGTVCLPDASAAPDLKRLYLLDQTSSPVLRGEFLPVRRATTQVLLSGRAARGRLSFRSDGDELFVDNGLGVDLDGLVVHGREGAYYALAADGLANGRGGALQRLEDRPHPSGWLAADFGEWDLGAVYAFPEGSYIASLATNPFVDACGLEPKQEEGTHVVFGILDAREAPWR